jgi:hypothetical protein
MKYHPIEMKMVLTRLRDALSAGRSEIEITLKLEALKTIHWPIASTVQRFNEHHAARP